MTPTAYIPVPISEAPKEDKAYLMMYPDGIFSNRMIFFSNGDWELNPEIRGYTHYLKPVDLSRMLEDCWNAALKWKYYQGITTSGLLAIDNRPNEPLDKKAYIDSVLNPPK